MIFLFSLGSACIFLAIYNCRKRLKAMSWPTVPGKIICSSLLSKTFEDSDGDPVTTYQAQIRYEYKVDGNSYVSNVWRFGVGFAKAFGEWDAKSTVERYPTGSAIAVFFNPANPVEAVLEPGKTRYVAAGIGWCDIHFAGIGDIVVKYVTSEVH